MLESKLSVKIENLSRKTAIECPYESPEGPESPKICQFGWLEPLDYWYK